MDKLKPCPFCGGEATITNLPHAAFGKWVVGCSRDSLCEIQPDVWRNSEAEAIEAWNTRAERTCTIEHRCDEYVCTACGNAVGDDDPWSENFVNGNAVEMWAYCPNCGAEVVE